MDYRVYGRLPVNADKHKDLRVISLSNWLIRDKWDIKKSVREIEDKQVMKSGTVVSFLMSHSETLEQFRLSWVYIMREPIVLSHPILYIRVYIFIKVF